MRLTRFISTLAISGAVAVLAACTTEAPPVVIQTPTPTPSLTVTTSPSPTPSPSPTREGLSTEELLELLPEHADIPDVRGAQIVARFFLKLREEIYAGNEESAKIWLSLSTDECSFCESVYASGVKFVEEGNTRSGGQIEIPDQVNIAYLEEHAPPVAIVELKFSADAFDDFDSDGNLLFSGEAESVTVAMRLVFDGELWLIDGVNPESQR